MSLYWRWVATVGGLAALLSTLGAIARAGIGYAPSWLAGLSGSIVVSLVAVLIRFAEASVIKSAFPRLSVRDYIAYSMPLIVLSPIAEATRLLTRLNVGGVAGPGDQPSGIALLVELAILALFLALVIKCFFLQWRAIQKVAEGRKSWRNTILLGLACVVIAALTYAKIAGLELRPADPNNWPDVQARLPITVIGAFTYALISGIGVARLRPIPESTL